MAPHRTRVSHPVQCPTCGKTISRKSDLKRHENTHTGEVTFPCTEEGCTYEAKQKSTLTEHIDGIHRGKRPYKCPEEDCPFDTAHPKSLTRHREEQHDYKPPPRKKTSSSDDQESEGVPKPPRRRRQRNASRPTSQSAQSPSGSSSSSSLSLTDEQGQPSSSGSVSPWDTLAALFPASDPASASPCATETIIDNFGRTGHGIQSPRDMPSPLSLSPSFYQGSETAHSGHVISHFAQVAPQSQSPGGSSSPPSLPLLLLPEEHVPVGSEVAAMTYHHNMTDTTGYSQVTSIASQAPMTQHPVPEQGYPYAMVPAVPQFSTTNGSLMSAASNEYTAAPSVSMPTTWYSVGNPLASAPMTLPSYPVRNVGIPTPAAIPRCGNQYHVGNMHPPATSSAPHGAQYLTNHGFYGHIVGDMFTPASTSSTSSEAQYENYGYAMLPPMSMSSTSSGAQYPGFPGNDGHTANEMSFGGHIAHQQTDGSFANTNMNVQAYPQAGGQSYSYTTHAGTSDLRRNRFHPY